MYIYRYVYIYVYIQICIYIYIYVYTDVIINPNSWRHDVQIRNVLPFYLFFGKNIQCLFAHIYNTKMSACKFVGTAPVPICPRPQ